MCLLIVFYLISWVHFIPWGRTSIPRENQPTNERFICDRIYICAFVSLLYKTAIVPSVFEIFFVQKYKHQQKDSLHLIKSFWFFVHSSSVLLCCVELCSVHLPRTYPGPDPAKKIWLMNKSFAPSNFFYFLNKHKFNIGRSIVLVSGIFMAIILILFLLLVISFFFVFPSSCTVTLEEKPTNLRFFFRLAENSSNALRTFPFSVSWVPWLYMESI